LGWPDLGQGRQSGLGLLLLQRRCLYTIDGRRLTNGGLTNFRWWHCLLSDHTDLGLTNGAGLADWSDLGLKSGRGEVRFPIARVCVNRGGWLTGILDVVMLEKATLAAGGLMPSITISLVTKDCRSSGKLFCNDKRESVFVESIHPKLVKTE
jgi:hypothetical protein